MASSRKQVKGLDIHKKKKKPVDFDPEDDGFTKQAASDGEDDNSEIDSDSAEELGGREHYERVSKSKLRKPNKTKLDEKKYGGQAVSRDKIFQDDDEFDALAPDDDEEDDDPFAAPLNGASESENEEKSEVDDVDELLEGEDVDGQVATDEEIESDEAFEEGEEDKFRGKGFVFRGSGKALKSLPTGSDDEEDDDEDGNDDVEGEVSGGSDVSDEDQSDVDMEEINEEDDSDLEGSEDDDEDEDEELAARPRPSTMKSTTNPDREALKALISNDTAALASSLSASQSADAQKGTAVKKQYHTFDRLLDARIKLQKGLTASTDIRTDVTTSNEEAQDALQKAEAAALKLFATIESLRHSILEASATTNGTDQPTSKKRKRPSSKTSTTDLWSRLSTLESRCLPTRHQTLDKWSTKTRTAAPITPATSTSKLSNPDQIPTKLSTVLSAYLQTETPKLVASFSSPAVTGDNTTTTHPPPLPYDDTTFYQSLLRDLINSRAATSSTSNPQSIPILPMKLHPSGNTTKARKIDTKASKGRKVRYTVHEKLENFTASEGRGNAVGQWNDGAVREFFGSLLGQSGMLGEDDVNGNGDGDADEGEDREVEALRLFST